MQTETITLDIPIDVLRRAEHIARQRQVTLADLMSETLADVVRQTTDYEVARQQHETILAQGFELGTRGQSPAPRDELHERKS